MIMGIAMDSSMMVLRERVKHEIMIIVSLHYGDGDVKTRIEKRMMMMVVVVAVEECYHFVISFYFVFIC